MICVAVRSLHSLLFVFVNCKVQENRYAYARKQKKRNLSGSWWQRNEMTIRFDSSRSAAPPIFSLMPRRPEHYLPQLFFFWPKIRICSFVALPRQRKPNSVCLSLRDKLAGSQFSDTELADFFPSLNASTAYDATLGSIIMRHAVSGIRWLHTTRFTYLLTVVFPWKCLGADYCIFRIYNAKNRWHSADRSSSRAQRIGGEAE